MYTIKHAARLTGVPEATLRAWERRYGLVTPVRNASGYRLYDPTSLARIRTVRDLVAGGWAPGEAARAVQGGLVLGAPAAGPAPARTVAPAEVLAPTELLLSAARILDEGALGRSLDIAFASGSFEQVAVAWLLPALAELGTAWARGHLDVAGEHLASQTVHRRLAAAFDAAGTGGSGPTVVVGLPPGSRHELGALTFATVCRRRGLRVVYLGADVPVASWARAAESCAADAVVLAVTMPADAAPAAEVVEHLRTTAGRRLVVAVGGAHAAEVAGDPLVLPVGILAAAAEVDRVARSALLTNEVVTSRTPLDA